MGRRMELGAIRRPVDLQRANYFTDQHILNQMKTICALLATFVACASVATAAIPTNYPTGPGPMNIVVGSDGMLIYQPDTNGDTIPDISNCGYMGGGVPIPTNIPVVLTLNPIAGDNLTQIQNAI